MLGSGRNLVYYHEREITLLSHPDSHRGLLWVELLYWDLMIFFFLPESCSEMIYSFKVGTIFPSRIYCLMKSFFNPFTVLVNLVPVRLQTFWQIFQRQARTDDELATSDNSLTLLDPRAHERWLFGVEHVALPVFPATRGKNLQHDDCLTWHAYHG